MGPKVRTIGENAFNGTKATDVYITAQTPPTAPNTTFSNYSVNLWLQDPGDNSVIDAYYDAYTCWDRFDAYYMIAPETIEVTVPTVEEGQFIIYLSAKIKPENVTLPDIFWSSDNPEIATVDCNGRVILHPLKEEVTKDTTMRECKITASTLYADGPIAEVTIINNSVTGIEIITSDGSKQENGEIDYAAPYDVYSINGVKIGNSVEDLVNGIYIVRQGNKSSKIAVK